MATKKYVSHDNLVEYDGLLKSEMTAGDSATLESAKSYAKTLADGKSNSSHNHDSRYYTESEIDSKLSGKSSTSHTHDLSTMINTLGEETSTPKDADYYVSQYAGGGTTTTTYHRRPMSALWNYIKSKLATVATSGSYNDLSNKPTIGNGTITITQNGTSKGTFTTNQTGNTTIALSDTNTNTTYSAGRGISLSGTTFKLVDTCTTITDWNSATTAGWYMGNNATNAPVSSGGWFYGEVVTHSTSYVRQILYHFATDNSVSGTNCDRYERVCHNGTWGSWVNTSVRVAVPSNAKFTDTTYSAATQSANGLMSSSDKKKLDGVATGAEVNQNAFSNVVVGSTTVAADSKTDTLTLAGSNVTLTPDATNDKITIGITKANVTSALGYTPPTTDTVYTHPTTSGNKHIPSGGSSGQILRWSADGTAAWGSDNNTDTKVTQTVTTSNATYPLLLAPSGQTANATTTAYFDSGVTLNPSTNTIVANITGNAATASSATKATQDSAGQQINTTYIKGLTASGQTVTYTKGDGTTGTITTQDTNTWRGIQNNLTSTSTTDSLSAAQGKILNDKFSSYVPTTRTVNGKALSANITLSASDVGAAASSHGTHVSYGTSASALGTSSAGTASTVSRSDHVHALPALTSCTGTLTLAKGGTGATTAAAARSNLGLGAAATYGVTTSVTSGSTALITSGAVYTGLAGKANSSHTHTLDQCGSYAFYGSDISGTSGWYKVYSGTCTGYANQGATLLLRYGYSNVGRGIISFRIRCSNTTILDVDYLSWEVRTGFNTGDVIIVTSGNTWTLYVKNSMSQHGRIEIRVLDSSGTSGIWDMVLANNNTVETTAPTATTTATDGGTVGYANHLGSSTVGSSTKPIYLNAGTPTACGSTIAIENSSTTKSCFRTKNSYASGTLQVSSSGNFGLYEESSDRWLFRFGTDSIIYLGPTGSNSLPVQIGKAKFAYDSTNKRLAITVS